MKDLTLAHFEAWLDGQIAFGIDETKATRHYDHYLAQHPTRNPSKRMREMADILPREVSAIRLKLAIETWKEQAA